MSYIWCFVSCCFSGFFIETVQRSMYQLPGCEVYLCVFVCVCVRIMCAHVFVCMYGQNAGGSREGTSASRNLTQIFCQIRIEFDDVLLCEIVDRGSAHPVHYVTVIWSVRPRYSAYKNTNTEFPRASFGRLKVRFIVGETFWSPTGSVCDCDDNTPDATRRSSNMPALQIRWFYERQGEGVLRCALPSIFMADWRIYIDYSAQIQIQKI